MAAVFGSGKSIEGSRGRSKQALLLVESALSDDAVKAFAEDQPERFKKSL